MPRVYVGEAPIPRALAEALAAAGYQVIAEKAPASPEETDLAVLPARAGILSALRHAVNNPLTAVLGFSELLSRRRELPEDVRAKIDTIREHAQRVRDLISGADEGDVV